MYVNKMNDYANQQTGGGNYRNGTNEKQQSQGNNSSPFIIPHRSVMMSRQKLGKLMNEQLKHENSSHIAGSYHHNSQGALKPLASSFVTFEDGVAREMGR